MFDTMWPSLAKLNFITAMITPIVKVSKGKVTSFFNLTDHHDWIEATPIISTGKTKYYKDWYK